MSAVRKVEFSTNPDAVIQSILDETQDIDQTISRFVKELRGRRAALLPALVESYITTTFLSDKRAKKKLGGKPKSKRMESLAKRMKRLQRQMEREAEAVAFVEQRFIAQIARDTTMHELWKLTTAKLGKRNGRGRALDHYSEQELAKYKIAIAA